MNNFDKRKYEERIGALNRRAKAGERYTGDLDIGECCYLLSLIGAVSQYRMKLITKAELFDMQKELENKLLSFYQHCELYDLHTRIRNRYSHILTEAEKSGCPICKKLVRVFDGRDTNG